MFAKVFLFFMANVWFSVEYPYDYGQGRWKKKERWLWDDGEESIYFQKWQIALFIVCQNYLLSKLLKYWSDVRIIKKQFQSLQKSRILPFIQTSVSARWRSPYAVL